MMKINDHKHVQLFISGLKEWINIIKMEKS